MSVAFLISCLKVNPREGDPKGDRSRVGESFVLCKGGREGPSQTRALDVCTPGRDVKITRLWFWGAPSHWRDETPTRLVRVDP